LQDVLREFKDGGALSAYNKDKVGFVFVMMFNA